MLNLVLRYVSDERYVCEFRVMGTQVRELYEFPEPVSEERAKERFLNDVAQEQDPLLAGAFHGSVKVNRLWKTSTSEQPQREVVTKVIPPEALEDEEVR